MKVTPEQLRKMMKEDATPPEPIRNEQWMTLEQNNWVWERNEGFYRKEREEDDKQMKDLSHKLSKIADSITAKGSHGLSSAHLRRLFQLTGLDKQTIQKVAIYYENLVMSGQAETMSILEAAQEINANTLDGRADVLKVSKLIRELKGIWEAFSW